MFLLRAALGDLREGKSKTRSLKWEDKKQSRGKMAFFFSFRFFPFRAGGSTAMRKRGTNCNGMEPFSLDV